MATNLKAVTQMDFSGGSNLVVNPYLISQKQAYKLINQVLDEHGSVRTRDGIHTISTSPDTVFPLLFRGNLIRTSGQEFPFAIQGGDSTGTVAFDANTVATEAGDGVLTKTFSHTGTGSELGIVVFLHYDNVGATTSVTHNAVAMSLLGTETVGDARIEAWGLVDATAGAQDIVVTMTSNSHGMRASATSFTGVGSFGATASKDSAAGGAKTIDITSDVDHVVIAGYCGGSTAVTPNNTLLYSNLFSDNDRMAAQYAAGAETVTMTWTGGAAAWVILGVDVSPVGGNTLWHTATDPWTDVGDLNAEVIPDVVYMSDKAIFLHGYATPKSWDGTTLIALVGGSGTAPGGAKHGVFHLGALWIWNTAETSGANDGPSSLEASATNDPNDWPTSNQIFISKDDGQEGMGIVPFTIVETGIAPTSTLVAFKNYRGFQITGTFGTSAFSIQPIKSDMGCIAPRSIQFVSGFGVIRLTHKGFALYNGVEDRLISEEVRPAIFGGPGFTKLDFTNIIRSWAQQSQNPPLYIAGCPVEGSDLTRFFVYDLVRRGWSLFTLPNAISCINLFFGRSQFPTIHMGTATGGMIQEFFTGDTTDNGEDIDWSFTSRHVFAGNPMTPSFWRRAQVSIAGPPNTPITITPIIEGSERDSQTFSLADSTDDQIESVLALDLLETAGFVQVRIEGTGPCKIRALEYQVSPKPSTKHTSRR